MRDLNIVSLFAVFVAKPIWQHAKKEKKHTEKKRTKQKHNNMVKKYNTLASKKKSKNTSSEVRVQASKKLKKQGFGRCT